MDFMYEGVTYESKPEVDESCNDCRFRNNKLGCEAANEKFNCGIHKISWGRKAENNQQGIKYDDNKLQYSLIPALALEALARNLTAGLSKYPRDNWKKVENAEDRYMDALYRHLEAHRKGEVYDSESSVSDMPHMAAVAVNAMFLLEFLLNKEIK